MFMLRTASRSVYRHLHFRRFSTPSSTRVTVPLERGSGPSKQHRPGGYHPIRPGELLNDRCEVVHRVGWGLYSTVWLVRDVRDKQMLALRVQINDLTTFKGPQHELSKLKILCDTNPPSPGHRHVCHLRDDFTLEGPHCKHVCLVLDPMRVSIFDKLRAFQLMLPSDLPQRISQDVLTALQYVHDECQIIHTDIKGDNIMLVSMPPKSHKKSIDVSIDELMTLPFPLSDFGSALRLRRISYTGVAFDQYEKYARLIQLLLKTSDTLPKKTSRFLYIYTVIMFLFSTADCVLTIGGLFKRIKLPFEQNDMDWTDAVFWGDPLSSIGETLVVPSIWAADGFMVRRSDIY